VCGTYSMHDGDKNCITIFWLEYLLERHLGIDGGIILKCILH
jgi:hypothetical protein